MVCVVKLHMDIWSLPNWENGGNCVPGKQSPGLGFRKARKEGFLILKQASASWLSLQRDRLSLLRQQG